MSANAYYSDKEFERQNRLAAKWQLCPHSVAREGRSRIVFDVCGRPIIRINADGTNEILSPDAQVKPDGSGPRPLHQCFGLMPGRRARDKITVMIEKFDLAPELQRRWDLQQRGELAGGWGW
ncbi:MAG: hypothetical protein GC182_19985 [Rhodopseudomonas sp.]|nr:hypothetical protein [Rhodopseudomonas sp.]